MSIFIHETSVRVLTPKMGKLSMSPDLAKAFGNARVPAPSAALEMMKIPAMAVVGFRVRTISSDDIVEIFLLVGIGY